MKSSTTLDSSSSSQDSMKSWQDSMESSSLHVLMKSSSSQVYINSSSSQDSMKSSSSQVYMKSSSSPRVPPPPPQASPPPEPKASYMASELCSATRPLPLPDGTLAFGSPWISARLVAIFFCWSRVRMTPQASSIMRPMSSGLVSRTKSASSNFSSICRAVNLATSLPLGTFFLASTDVICISASISSASTSLSASRNSSRTRSTTVKSERPFVSTSSSSLQSLGSTSLVVSCSSFRRREV
mmetsp:Transcript_103480/g.166834  ORF Transcript_103480/g.166834 Transcript_103480/m.166834 type:complete len:241 (-) Transcript_103480:1235-1957(-)